ncbi:OLC1v1002528C1 [Oldenlandia corymbosa var. corymbosa]|uniref:OLC1v1002528C1 n=1 Tax=Oldenlandia corymbosa var. corymbosa TaxID=529605 RepID=A0AAV1DB86_OLDCO|nr:OLC1v1002528C1 [Oldenlandia corymbosa var. corymbosa]
MTLSSSPLEEPGEAEKIPTENDGMMITMTGLMNQYWMKWMIMSEPEELDAADILIQLSGSVSHSGRSAIDSPGPAGSSSSCNKGDADNNSIKKLAKLSRDDDEEEESFCATAVAGGGGREVRLPLSSSSSFFRPAELQKRDLVDADDDESVEMGCGEIEGYPLRRKRKFRSILDLYARTHPSPVTKKSKTQPLPRRSTIQ